MAPTPSVHPNACILDHTALDVVSVNPAAFWFGTLLLINASSVNPSPSPPPDRQVDWQVYRVCLPLAPLTSRVVYPDQTDGLSASRFTLQRVQGARGWGGWENTRDLH